MTSKTVVVIVLLAVVSMGMALILPIRQVYTNTKTLYDVAYKSTLDSNNWMIDSTYKAAYLKMKPKFILLCDYETSYQDVWYNYDTRITSNSVAQQLAASGVNYIDTHVYELYHEGYVDVSAYIGKWWFLVFDLQGTAYLVGEDAATNHVFYISYLNLNTY